MTVLPPIFVAFAFLPGCSACDATKPHVERFKQRNPDVRVEAYNMLETHWPFEWKPPGFPTFLLVRRGTYGYRAIVGAHTTEQLEYWVRVKSREGDDRA